jgi:ribosomal protein S18 acetylase RimI-like enzyme
MENKYASSESSIRKMKPADVQQVVDIHLQAFQGFFLTFLGPNFLRELYQAIQSDPSGIALVCEEEAKMVGFAAGTDQPAGLYRRLLKQRWYRFGLASIMPVLRQPSIIPRLLRAFRISEEVGVLEGCGTLMSIAVSPQCQSNGAGQALVAAFLLEAAGRDLKFVNLTTDTNNNDRVNRFYRKLGFTCARTFITPEGRRMNEYIIPINPVIQPSIEQQL